MNEELAIGPLDRHFGKLMLELNGAPSEELRSAAEIVSARRGEGDICISLRDLPQVSSDVKAMEKKLRASRVVGQPGENKPLILDAQDRLYLQRYWAYQQQLAEAIRARISSPPPVIDEALLARGLRDFFGDDPRVDWQRRAAETAVRKNFCVITGGPGTGKTRTVLIVLMLLHGQFTGRGVTPRIALAAPTGKAAARMKESIQGTLESLPEGQSFAPHLPSDATTIHRLLGVVPDSPFFRHNAGHPLAAEVLIVDEASMVDLALMAKLLDAAPPNARLILLGDKDQLASVEAGCVMGDIWQAGEDARREDEQNRLHEHIVELKANFRFGNDSAIYNLSRCITEGRSEDALAILGKTTSDEIRSQPLPAPATLSAALRQPVLNGFRSYFETREPREALARLNGFRILCGLRGGPYGVDSLNPLVERILAAEGLIQPDARHYEGRPILIRENEYQLKLFNGDVGVVLRDPEAGGALRAFFLTSEGLLRRFIPARLPPHETVFAMTVHKSQGSEFARVLLILPDRASRVITRELIYTGLTRAREGLELWHREEILRTAIETPTKRASGLRDALSSRPAAPESQPCQ